MIGGGATDGRPGGDAAEDQLMLELAVFLVVAPPRLPNGLGRRRGIPPRRPRLGIGGRRLAVQGKRLPQAPVVQLDQFPQMVQCQLATSVRVALEGRDVRYGHPDPTSRGGRPADRGGVVSAIGVGRGEGEEPDPRRQPVLRADAREGHMAQEGAAHVGDGTDQRAPVRQLELDVHRASLAVARQRSCSSDQVFDGRQHLVQDRLAEGARRQDAPGHLGRHAPLDGGAGQTGLQEPLADTPLLQAVQGDGQGVADIVGIVADGDAEPLAEKRLDGMLGEPHQLLDFDRIAGCARQRLVQERRRLGPIPEQGPRPFEGHRVEAPRPPGDQPPDGEVAGVEGLQRMVDDHDVRGGGAGLVGIEPGTTRTVRSTRSSSSPTGTAGDRSALVRSSRPA